MASSGLSQGLGGPSKAGRVLGPSLDKIIKNVAWRKQSQLVQACKTSLDRLQHLSPSPEYAGSSIPGFPPADADQFISSLTLAVDSAAPKVIEPALECVQRLALLGLVRCDAEQIDDDPASSPAPAILINSVCKCTSVADNAIELAVLRTLLASVRSSSLGFHGDALIHIVKTFYNVYLGSTSVENRICAKAALAQTVAIVFARAEADRVEANADPVSVPALLELSDKNLNESGLVQSVQVFLIEVLEGWEGDRGGNSTAKEETGEGESRIREDALNLFKNLCKFSMKFSTQESPEDELLLRGKLLSLELMKVVVEYAGPVLRVNERFLGATRQYLCLSLLKNSALSVMSVFQLLCSIFMSLLSRLRSGLKAETGIFFPMLVLRVLENVLQPSFLQKMTVLNLLEKMCEDPQLVIDIFVNYDCDVESPNIFERIVNGLLKTALGVPPGSVTTLSPAQDIAFRHESVRCLVAIIKAMGQWMDQQLRIVETRPLKDPDLDSLGVESHSMLNGEEGSAIDYELHSESYGELSEAANLEQRRAYKIELQKGISLFNRKPSKGIEFLTSTKKIGGTPEEVVSFLKNTAGLNETMIGDYLGEREEFALKVMHAYVDSMNLEKMDFGEAIRFFLRGFRLPGEAQKIDRIMEKFAERYCKCNPNSFSSADTAYVLAYSVIMLNTDAHNSMVKDKMSKSDFLRNNRGIDNGKDLPEDYLGSLYDQIVKNEIKMNAESLTPQKQANSINKLLGLDNILNLVNWKQPEEKALGASDVLLRHIQEMFKAKTNKSESIFYMVNDVAILRFMVEVCWAPMLAAFSVNLDQSDEKVIAFQCLQGFRQAVHVTSVMYMQTQRDAFVTSVAKFTFLHCAADMKQKNVEAVKAIISIAIEDGNYLQEAWEHILTCLSRFENLLLLGEGAPPDSLFPAVPQVEADEKAPKSPAHQLLKKKGAALQHPAIMAVLRGGSYDSVVHAVNVTGAITPDQINNLISNLNMLDQIGNYELNHIFVHSQRLNSEAIVAFVKALCKVSMSELQSPSDPQVFSLMKIVEIAHYNMNRIRLVWSRIWQVLCEFFVSVGLSENLSVSIFVMDSLRQLTMKFLEREELANYNFQSDFLKPFVIIMQKSNSAEIRELIVRCVSQMVLVRVSNVKSGWKSVFMVFTTAASDERKNIVLLAFETIEKIVRDYFPYITETETTTFTDCVRCLIAFTISRYNSDVGFNAIAFLRFCAVKLAEGGLICYEGSKEASDPVNGDVPDNHTFTDKDEHVYYWVPLLTGLSKLTSDPRPAIRKSALEVLFNTLRDHGHLFSLSFWIRVYKSVVFPIFDTVAHGKGVSLDGLSIEDTEGILLENVWSSETCALAAQYLVDLFSGFFDIVRLQLKSVVSIVTSFIRNPTFASIGVSAFLRLTSNVGNMLLEDEWLGILLLLKEAAASTQPSFLLIKKTMDGIEIPDSVEAYPDGDLFTENELPNDEPEDDSLQVASYCVSRMKGHIAVQLLIIQALMDLYKTHRESLTPSSITILLATFSSVCQHAHEMNSHAILQEKLHKVGLILEVSDPPSLHLENDSYQNYLKFLQTLIDDNPSLSEERGIELQLVAACEKILEIYLDCAGVPIYQQLPGDRPKMKWVIPLGTIKKEELAARTSLLVLTLQVLCNLEKDTFKKYIRRFFPLLVNLIRCEHSSGEVQRVLTDLFQFCIGPIIIL